MDKAQTGSWKDGSTVKSTCCSFRVPVFISQHPHGASQPSVTPVSGDPIPSSDFHRHQACVWHIYIHGSRTSHIKKVNDKNLKIDLAKICRNAQLYSTSSGSQKLTEKAFRKESVSIESVREAPP